MTEYQGAKHIEKKKKQGKGNNLQKLWSFGTLSTRMEGMLRVWNEVSWHVRDKVKPNVQHRLLPSFVR